LVTQSYYGIPQRTVTGIPPKRLAILLAVLEKRLGLRFGSQDVFVNTTGGLQIQEPAADLAVMAALISSLNDKPIHRGTICIGEVGLTGEVRAVSRIDQRISEAARLGFKKMIVPAANMKKVKSAGPVQCTGIRTVSELTKYATGS